MYVTTHQALSSRDGELADRTEVIDALYRFGLGQDLRDRELFASAFAADAELDFRPTAVRDGERWTMRRIRIDNVWCTGEPKVIFG